jgi:ribose transport system permease protein
VSGTEAPSAAPAEALAHRRGDGRLGALVARGQRGGILLAFIALFIALAVGSPYFATKVNLLNIVDQQASTLVIAAAMTLVLVAGGIDLSVGAVYVLAGVVAAEVAQSASSTLAIILGILVGLGAGLVNGVIVTVFRMNALIATLAMSFVVGGLASIVTQGNLVVLVSHPGFGDLAETQFLGVKTSIWLMLVAVVVVGVTLGRTTIGHYMYAVGGNISASRLAGVRTSLVRICTYMVAGGMAGLGGVIDDARTLSAQGSSYSSGEDLTFTVLAGVVIGGTSILGGEGAVWRSVVGVLFIALIGNGYALLNLNPLYQQITLGALMLFAIGLDAWARRRG